MPIRMFKLITLSDAFCMARMQEATNTAMKARYNSQPSIARSANVNYSNYRNRGNGILPRPATQTLALPATKTATYNSNMPYRKQLTKKELEE